MCRGRFGEKLKSGQKKELRTELYTPLLFKMLNTSVICHKTSPIDACLVFHGVKNESLRCSSFLFGQNSYHFLSNFHI